MTVKLLRVAPKQCKSRLEYLKFTPEQQAYKVQLAEHNLVYSIQPVIVISPESQTLAVYKYVRPLHKSVAFGTKIQEKLSKFLLEAYL